MEGFHPGPTSISRSSVTWSKTTPFHRRQKETTREKRKRKNKEREREKRREKATRSVVSPVQNNVDPRRETLRLSNARDGMDLETGEEGRAVETSGENLFALEIIS